MNMTLNYLRTEFSYLFKEYFKNKLSSKKVKQKLPIFKLEILLGMFGFESRKYSVRNE